MHRGPAALQEPPLCSCEGTRQSYGASGDAGIYDSICGTKTSPEIICWKQLLFSGIIRNIETEMHEEHGVGMKVLESLG